MKTFNQFILGEAITYAKYDETKAKDLTRRDVIKAQKKINTMLTKLKDEEEIQVLSDIQDHLNSSLTQGAKSFKRLGRNASGGNTETRENYAKFLAKLFGTHTTTRHFGINYTDYDRKF